MYLHFLSGTKSSSSFHLASIKLFFYRKYFSSKDWSVSWANSCICDAINRTELIRFISFFIVLFWRSITTQRTRRIWTGHDQKWGTGPCFDCDLLEHEQFSILFHLTFDIRVKFMPIHLWGLFLASLTRLAWLFAYFPHILFCEQSVRIIEARITFAVDIFVPPILCPQLKLFDGNSDVCRVMFEQMNKMDLINRNIPSLFWNSCIFHTFVSNNKCP